MITSRALKRRVNSIPQEDVNGVAVIKDFGVFIDTHRDDPAIPSFSAIPRGYCKPIPVDYDPAHDMFVDGSSEAVDRHDKHRFLYNDQYRRFLTDALMGTGSLPFLGKTGIMPTALLRDHRQGRNVLRSFRQVAMQRYRTGKP